MKKDKHIPRDTSHAHRDFARQWHHDYNNQTYPVVPPTGDYGRTGYGAGSGYHRESAYHNPAYGHPHGSYGSAQKPVQRPPRGYLGDNGYPGETEQSRYPLERDPRVPHINKGHSIPRPPEGYVGHTGYPGEGPSLNYPSHDRRYSAGHTGYLGEAARPNFPPDETQFSPGHSRYTAENANPNYPPSEGRHYPVQTPVGFPTSPPTYPQHPHEAPTSSSYAARPSNSPYPSHPHNAQTPTHYAHQTPSPHWSPQGYGRPLQNPRMEDFPMQFGRAHSAPDWQHGAHSVTGAPSDAPYTVVKPLDTASISGPVSMPPAWPPNAEEPNMSSFRASSGRRRALLIGINYSGTEELRGCVRDVEFMAYLLQSEFGFRNEDLFIMTDEPHKVKDVHSGKPTRNQMFDAMHWLVRGADRGDSLFFYFSGHGGWLPDEDGDEADGIDETICPVDHHENGMITDDDLYDTLVRRVPRGARLTAVMDSCHSGTGMDLPYLHDVETGDMHDDRMDGLPEKESKVKRVLQRVGLRKKKLPRCPRPDSKGGEVLLISGCRDHESSCEDHTLAGVPTGAMTFCLVEAIEKGRKRDWRQYTYKSLLLEMKEKLSANVMEQTPQFSTAHPFNLNTPFLL